MYATIADSSTISRHGRDGEEQAVPHRRDHQVVPGADDLFEIFDEPPFRGEAEVAVGCLQTLLCCGQDNEDEWHNKDDERHRQRDDLNAVGAEPTRDAHSSTSWRLKNRIIGNTIKVIAMNMITLPAVASP